MNNAREFCSSYLHATEEIIAALREDDFSKVDELLNQREKLLQELEACGLKKEILHEEIDVNRITALEQTLKSIIKDKEADIGQRLHNLSKAKKVNTLYYNVNNNKSIVFNKTI